LSAWAAGWVGYQVFGALQQDEFVPIGIAVLWAVTGPAAKRMPQLLAVKLCPDRPADGRGTFVTKKDGWKL
jgi:hypothetical protein